MSAAAVLLIAPPSAAQEPAPALVLEPFSLRGFDGTEQTVELGRLTVPADRGDPGRAVSLPTPDFPSRAELLTAERGP